MSFDREGYGALKQAGDPAVERLTRTTEADAFKFLLDSLAEQRKAIRALAQRVAELEAKQSGDTRYAEAQQDHDDPTALEVW